MRVLYFNKRIFLVELMGFSNRKGLFCQNPVTVRTIVSQTLEEAAYECKKHHDCKGIFDESCDGYEPWHTYRLLTSCGVMKGRESAKRTCLYIQGN